MQETYTTLGKVAELYEGPKELEELAFEYQFNEDPAAFAYAFRKLFGTMVQIAKSKYGLDYEDKVSICCEELHSALMNYERRGGSEKKATLHTMYAKYLNRRFYAETRLTNMDKRKANSPENCTPQGDDSYMEKLTADTTQEYNAIELVQAIDSSDNLTRREKDYCKHLVTSTGALSKDSEIAKELGVSPSAINQLKKRLADKLPASLLTV